jgi:hypothetical protein
LGAARPVAAEPASLENDAFTAWLYVLPLIEMAGVRARLSERGADGRTLPANTVVHAPGLSSPQSRSVTAPNRDTLYSVAFVDLTAGPVTMVLPSTGRRYFSVTVFDMYTDAGIVVGTRTTGGAAGRWRIVGAGQAARDDHDLRLATPHGWLLLRVLPDSEGDLAAAQRVQQGFVLSGRQADSPLGYASRSSPWSAYFRSAQRLLDSDPPVFRLGLDAVERLRRAGRRDDFDRDAYDAGQVRAIEAGVTRARALVEQAGRAAKFRDGWSDPPPGLGAFGDQYIYRAQVAAGGIGALPREEAMYLRSAGDDGAGLFRGDGLYRLHLAKPVPVNAFWSLTMYEATPDGQFFLCPNGLGRYAIGDRTEGLVRGADGSLDIWIGRYDPGGARRANWLPAPASGPFSLTLRAYLPDRPLLSGDYRLPPVTRVA